MAAPIFIGDEVSGAGYRLAGADVRVPAQDDVTGVFRQALRETDFVILTTASAAMLPPPLIDEAVHRAAPLILIVPDAVGQLVPPDYSITVARALGIAA